MTFRELRRLKNHSQESLAKAADVSLSSVVRLDEQKMGPRGPHPTTVTKVAGALGKTPEELRTIIEKK
jgi:transcriptional regulator with XRE-family HTH domain